MISADVFVISIGYMATFAHQLHSSGFCSMSSAVGSGSVLFSPSPSEFPQMPTFHFHPSVSSTPDPTSDYSVGIRSDLNTYLEKCPPLASKFPFVMLTAHSA